MERELCLCSNLIMDQDEQQSSPMQLEYAKVEPGKRPSVLKSALFLVFGLLWLMVSLACVTMGILCVVFVMGDGFTGKTSNVVGFSILLLFGSILTGCLAYQMIREFVHAFWSKKR